MDSEHQQQSERERNHSNLASALIEAQKELKNPAKDAENPYFQSRYATLDALQDASRAVLAKHGLSITQTCLPSSGAPITFEKVQIAEGAEGFKLHPFLWLLKTSLVHQSGATIESVMPLVSATRGPQAFGGEITYMRRYAYAAILNMTADEDDDGNVAGGKPALRPTTEKGPVDTDKRPDEIPGLEKPEIPPAWLKEPGVKKKGELPESLKPVPPPDEESPLDSVRNHLRTDGFAEEELMSLMRNFKLTKEIMLEKVNPKTLKTMLNKWETVQGRIQGERALRAEQKKEETEDIL